MGRKWNQIFKRDSGRHTHANHTAVSQFYVVRDRTVWIAVERLCSSLEVG